MGINPSLDWIRVGVYAVMKRRLTNLEMLAGYPQPRQFIFVGPTDNGPRNVFMYEVVEVWVN